MIRQIRRLSNLTLPNSPLLRNDCWAADTLNGNTRVSKKYSAALQFAKHVSGRQYDEAWRSVDAHIERDDLFLQNFRAEICSKFLRELPSGSHNAQYYWPHARRFARAMKTAGIELSLQDYLSLISLSFKAHDYSAVHELWKEIETSRPELLSSVQLWNQYIQASCQAYPLFWPLYANSDKDKKAERLPAENRPPESEDLLQILRKMETVSVHPNARTYELIIMAFARQGRLNTCEQILNQAWINGSPANWTLMYPEISTLKAIVEAWAFNQELPQGIEFMKCLVKKYEIPIASPSARHLWTRIFRLTQVNLKPTGAYPKEFFESLWDLAQDYGVKPSLSMWSIRMEYFKRRGDFDKLVDALPQVAEVSCGETEHFQVNKMVCNGLNHTVKYLTNGGRALEALELMDEWAAKGFDVRQQLESYIQRRTGMTSAQNKTFKEDDDDNDWF